MDPFFLDTNVFVYALTSTEYSRGAIAVLAAVADGAPGCTSVTVLGELLHLELSGRVGRIDGLAARALEIVSDVLRVGREQIAAALAARPARLGANDRIILATCREHAIPTIVSADRGFDRVAGLRRVDPTPRAVASLLG